MTVVSALPVRFRWGIAWMLCAGTALNFIARTNIAFVLTEVSKEFEITATAAGFLLAAFFGGYIVFNLVGGWSADRFGPRLTLGVSLLCCGLATGVSAGVRSASALFVARGLVGAASGPVFPTCAQVVTRWFPVQERGRATAVFDVGSYIGSALAGPLVVGATLIAGWRGALLVCAGLLLLWPIGWFLVYPGERRKEATVVVQNTSPGTSDVWSRLLSDRKVWGMAYGFFCYNYVKVFYLSWLPTFLLHKALTSKAMAFASALPPLSAIMGELAAGAATDRLLQRGFSVTRARKIPLCLGFLLSTVMVLAGVADSPAWAVAWLMIGYTAIISASPGIWAIPGDVSPTPEAVGRLGGLQNAVANVGSLLSPIVTGYLWTAYHSFLPALLLSAAIAASGAFAYWVIVGELEPIGVRRGTALHHRR